MQDPTRSQAESGTETDGADASMSRRLSRLERQARVGILRNPNSPPRPPARRATLTGRWPSLRSSRRPPGSVVQDAADSVVTQLSAQQDRAPQVTVKDGKTSIDVASLMASVEDVGTVPPSRSPFAAAFRDDVPAASPKAARPRRASILSKDAWIDDQDSPEDEDALGDAFRDAAEVAAEDAASSLAPRNRWRGLVMIVLLLVMLGAMALIVFPAAAVQFLRGPV